MLKLNYELKSRKKEFIKVKDIHGLEQLLKSMSEFSFNKADVKLKIKEKFMSFKNEQSTLF